MPELIEFLGVWQVSRRIADANDPRPARFDGKAAFTPNGSGLTYHESGLLTLGDGQGLRAERTYHWQAGFQGIAVFFADGRPFHAFAADGDATATHWCDPDTYVVRYDFRNWPDWESCWQVTGPRKNYRMTTLYRRA